MCKCTPEIRTPFCGKMGCEIPPGWDVGIKDKTVHTYINTGAERIAELEAENEKLKAQVAKMRKVVDAARDLESEVMGTQVEFPVLPYIANLGLAIQELDKGAG